MNVKFRSATQDSKPMCHCAYSTKEETLPINKSTRYRFQVETFHLQVRARDKNCIAGWLPLPRETPILSNEASGPQKRTLSSKKTQNLSAENALLHSLFGIHCGHRRRARARSRHNRRRTKAARGRATTSTTGAACPWSQTALATKRRVEERLSDREVFLLTFPTSFIAPKLGYSVQSVQSFSLSFFFLLR